MAPRRRFGAPSRWRAGALPVGGLLLLVMGGTDEAAAAPRVVLEPVVTDLVDPVFVTHARDGTDRLFVVERDGRIKVRSPGTGALTVFLDITGRVLAGGERGLLGLTFHHRYPLTGRFFVNYTRRPDGATVIAEYRVSADDPGTARTDELTLLVIPQPFANHNGGMIEFGPDGLLYIGMGDGGAQFDPGRRAQDPTTLLGKILRIDVDPPAAAPGAYASPPDNPFAGSHSGRDEVFALGFRNPWRFSFDRATGALYVGDVGQGAREEIDRVNRGGNYGWPILEGFRCLGLGALPCDDPSLIAPIAEYDHGGGRCSVTGGHVYRGNAGTLPAGAYVFGDFCSGEVFALLDGGVSLLLSTGLSIASFGEDEAGEIHVVDLGGTLYRLANLDAPTLALSVNQRRLAPGDTIRVSVRARTGDLPVAADGYFGIVQPGGRTAVFLTSARPLAGVIAPLDGDARALPPIAPALVIPPGTDAVMDDFFAYTVGAAEAPGTYVVFAALARPGALADGAVDPGDLLTIAVETLTVGPAPD